MSDQINNKKNSKSKKRRYEKPSIEKVKIDNEISMVMMSPPGDPWAFNPFKLIVKNS